MAKKAILAFSGGLDTSFCVLWLKEKGYQVITCTVDTGGFTKAEFKEIEAKAKELGVLKHISIDAKKEFYKKVVTYIIRGNLQRGGIYPLCVGPERIIQAAKVVETAREENAKIIVHGSTGAGNDQVRFDTAVRILYPECQILAPIRDLGMTRKKETEYLLSHGFAVSQKSTGYSVNTGILGTTIGGGETKNSWESPPENVYPGYSGSNVSKSPIELMISFKEGLPVDIKVQRLMNNITDGLNILQLLNQIGNKYGIGRGIHLGTTILGIKGRVAFSAPGISILIKAHQELEKLVMTQNQLFWKETLCQVYGNLIHESSYFDALGRDIEKFIESSQKHVTGLVRLKLFDGYMKVLGAKSPYSLMDLQMAIYGEENKLWDGRDAAGFSKIYGIESLIWQSKDISVKKENL